MILITGGAYQGKLDYAKEAYGLTDEDVFTCEEGSTAVGFDEKIVDHFERYVLALIKAGQVPEKAVGMQLRANRYKGRIIICDDISQGIVPLDATERAWREGVGRTMVKIAQQADKVVRVFCGIPEIVKDETAEEVKTEKTDGLEAVFRSEANGAVRPEAAETPEKYSEEVKPEDKPHGIGGRGQNQAPRTPFGMPGANPFEHYDFGNAEEGGLTPEEQFRINFEKMKAERKAAKEKAAKEQAAKNGETK
ncbi:MAG: bifunctional adenosylcobinamide kinase/adenosylcobinamide-phosphate guanylyltransferase [Eubacterium sp.]|nr:bifunctional adenosylcobinamide kinase/adenosylcobinamide-phosphate guanylyltransferase [Eubacterium sp.]